MTSVAHDHATCPANDASAGPFARLASVSLAQVDAEAALQTRVDRKYIIDRSELDALFVELGTAAQVLEIDGVRSLGYESTYYDTPEQRCYHDAARSRPNRFKVRTRTYLDTNTHVLEVKTRGRDRQTVKSRRSGLPDDHLALSRGSQDYVAETVQSQLSGRALVDVRAEVGRLVPSLRTSYQRTTLLISQSAADGNSDRSTRATIDTSLVFSDPTGASQFHPQVVIVETKTAGRPSPVDQLLWRSGHRPVKVSKYGTGLALLHPQLPATKWNRVLRRCFNWHRAGE